MRRQLLPALLMMVVLTVLAGFVFPLAITGVAQLGFKDKADGSLVTVDGKTVGSKLVGQTFTKAEYFQGRPSAAGAAATGSDATDPDNAKKTVANDPKDLTQVNSSGSNLGPTNPDLIDAVKARVVQYRKDNRLAVEVKVPVDAVTSSASGLDPHISVANARIQAGRVARVRGTPVAKIRALVDQYTDGSTLGVLGEQGVNVLELNLALDRLAPS